MFKTLAKQTFKRTREAKAASNAPSQAQQRQRRTAATFRDRTEFERTLDRKESPQVESVNRENSATTLTIRQGRTNVGSERAIHTEDESRERSLSISTFTDRDRKKYYTRLIFQTVPRAVQKIDSVKTNP
jgi:hypothetical protein